MTTERQRASTPTIDVWSIALDAVRRGPAEATLSSRELERAARRSGLERDRFVARHAALRLIASERLGRPARDIGLEAAYGRPPVCAGAELSLSHAGGHALVAVAPVGVRVGVDLEACTALPLDEVDDLADFVLTSREIASIPLLEPEDRRRTVLTAWCRKEAYLKLRGRGIGDTALADIEISAGRVTRAGADDVRRVHLADVDGPSGHVAAVAYEGARARVTRRRLTSLEEEVLHVAR